MKKTLSILSILFFLGTSMLLTAQEKVTSEWSKIRINTISQQSSNVDTIPPSIKIISPVLNRGQSYYTTDVNMISLIGKVTDNQGYTNLLINSKKVIPNSSGLFNEEIDLVQGENTFNILALDQNNNLTETKLVVNYSPTQSYSEKINIDGEYYALIIANEEYEDPRLFNLHNPIDDANALYKVLTERYVFDPQNIDFLQNATWENTMNALDNLSRKLKPEDNLLIFYAGHGQWDPDANIGYWLPSNAHHDRKTRWVRNSTIQDYLKEIKSNHILLVTDACFAGSIFQSRSISSRTSVAIKTLYDLPSRKAMTSGTLTEVPDESVFVKYFIDRLVENDNKFITAQELFNSFRLAVINNSEALPQYGVVKNVGDEGGDFIFILK